MNIVIKDVTVRLDGTTKRSRATLVIKRSHMKRIVKQLVDARLKNKIAPKMKRARQH